MTVPVTSSSDRAGGRPVTRKCASWQAATGNGGWSCNAQSKSFDRVKDARAGRSWALVGEVMAHQGDRNSRTTVPSRPPVREISATLALAVSSKPFGAQGWRGATGETRNGNAECWKARRGSGPVRSPLETGTRPALGVTFEPPWREQLVTGRASWAQFVSSSGDAGWARSPWETTESAARNRITPVVAPEVGATFLGRPYR